MGGRSEKHNCMLPFILAAAAYVGFLYQFSYLSGSSTRLVGLRAVLPSRVAGGFCSGVPELHVPALL